MLASYRAEAEELRSLFQHESILATLGAFALIESVDTLFHKDSNTLQKWLSVLTGTGVSVVFCTTTHPEALATPFLEAMTCILHLPVPETSIDKRAVWLQVRVSSPLAALSSPSTQNLADVGIDVHSGAKNGKIGVREAELFSLIANDSASSPLSAGCDLTLARSSVPSRDP